MAALALVSALAVSFFFAKSYFDEKQRQERNAKRARDKVPANQPELKDVIGGAWRLTDMNGEKMTEEDFFGKYVVIYFGFTFCPEICPKELHKLSAALRELESRDDKVGERIVPLFFSVDPKRDSPAQMKKYVAEFHPRLIGLTGTPEQVKRTAQTFKVFYRSDRNEEGSDQDDYNVDHSTYMFFMDRDGVFRGILHSSDDADACAEKMSTWIREDDARLDAL